MARLLQPEMMIGIVLIALVTYATVGLNAIEPKYKLAIAVGLVGSAWIVTRPERRIICIALWVLIHPLSIEKVFSIDAAESPLFLDPSININASDGPLFLLIAILLWESVATRRSALRWSRVTSVCCYILAWSLVSYGIHALILTDGFTISSPLQILQNVRLAVFTLLIQSAVRTRGDLICILLAVAGAVLFQSLIVGISYATGAHLTYAAATAAANTDTSLQSFSSSGAADIVRASGTVGHTNEQAAFHVFLTLPLIGLFGARNPHVRTAAIIVVAGSALALVLTFSRGSWIAFPLGLVAAAVVSLRRGLIGRKTILVGATGTIGIALILLVLAKPIYERLVFGDSGATDSRLRMLVLARDLFQAFPIIGVGPGEFADAALRMYPARYIVNDHIVPGEILPYPPPVIGRVDIVQGIIEGHLRRRPLPVHNKYMLQLAELGIPGLLLWLWLYAEFMRGGWRCSREQDGILQMAGIGGIALLAAEIFYMNVDLFHEDKPLQFLFFGPALVCAAARLVQDRKGSPLTCPPATSLRPAPHLDSISMEHAL